MNTMNNLLFAVIFSCRRDYKCTFIIIIIIFYKFISTIDQSMPGPSWSHSFCDLFRFAVAVYHRNAYESKKKKVKIKMKLKMEWIRFHHHISSIVLDNEK